MKKIKKQIDFTKLIPKGILSDEETLKRLAKMSIQENHDNPYPNVKRRKLTKKDIEECYKLATCDLDIKKKK